MLLFLFSPKVTLVVLRRTHWREKRVEERNQVGEKKWWWPGKTGVDGNEEQHRQSRNILWRWNWQDLVIDLSVKGEGWEVPRMATRFLPWDVEKMVQPAIEMRKSPGQTGLVGNMISMCHLFSKSFHWNANYFNPLQSVKNYYSTIINLCFRNCNIL